MPGFYWAFLALSPDANGGLVALFVISAIVMIFVCVIGILGACNICFPIFLIMWLIGTAILSVVIVVQIILNATLDCASGKALFSSWVLSDPRVSPDPNGASSIVCGGTANYSAVSWAGLGVTLGLAVIGFIFGVILFKIYKDDEGGGTSAKGGNDYGKRTCR